MTNVYSGIKEISHVISDTKRVTDMILGVRTVLVNGFPLPSALIQEECENDNYRVYDWGRNFSGNYLNSYHPRNFGFNHPNISCNRMKGINLAGSILDYQYPNVNIEYELVYMFFKDVISKLSDTFLLTGDEIENYMPILYKKVFGEEL